MCMPWSWIKWWLGALQQWLGSQADMSDRLAPNRLTRMQTRNKMLLALVVA